MVVARRIGPATTAAGAGLFLGGGLRRGGREGRRGERLERKGKDRSMGQRD
jgi:hypothetical protein